MDLKINKIEMIVKVSFNLGPELVAIVHFNERHLSGKKLIKVLGWGQFWFRLFKFLVAEILVGLKTVLYTLKVCVYVFVRKCT